MPQEFCSNPKSVSSNDLRVGVFCGGNSSERKISLLSGRAVYHALKRAGFSTRMIDPAKPHCMRRSLRLIDVAFLALHGRGGEDGAIQKYLDRRGVPYVGSDVHGSRNAFDKLFAKRLFERFHIPTPPYRILTPSNWRATLFSFPGPWVIKPPCEGSSIGVFVVEDFRKSAEKIKWAVRKYGKLLAEKKIQGRELTVGVLGHRALPPV
jgi:D-alanine-D-alanine ligase